MIVLNIKSRRTAISKYQNQYQNIEYQKQTDRSIKSENQQNFTGQKQGHGVADDLNAAGRLAAAGDSAAWRDRVKVGSIKF